MVGLIFEVEHLPVLVTLQVSLSGVANVDLVHIHLLVFVALRNRLLTYVRTHPVDREVALFHLDAAVRPLGVIIVLPSIPVVVVVAVNIVSVL